MLNCLINYILIASGIIHGLLVLNVNVLEQMAMHPNLHMLVLPLLVVVGVAAVLKLVMCVIPSCMCMMRGSCSPDRK